MLARYKICPSCGEENQAQASDCARCGADILGERMERRAVPDSPSARAGSSSADSQIVDSRGGATPVAEGSADDEFVDGRLEASPVSVMPWLQLESLVAPRRSFRVEEGQTVGRS